MNIREFIEQFRSLSRIQKVVFCFFFLSVFWVVASSTFNMVNQQLIRTMTVGSEYTDVVYSDYGFIQAEEALITAEASGSTSITVEEGVRVPKNHEVFSLTRTNKDGESSTVRYYAPVSGIVSYRIDGYENMSDIEEIRKLDFRGIYEETFNSDAHDQSTKDAVSGEVYAKVIDNLKETYIYMSYNPADNHLIEEVGDTFRIRFPELNEATTGTVEEIIETGNGKEFCKISLGPVSETFLTNRVVQTEIYQSQSATLDLERSAIVVEDGEPGVYVVSGGVVVWQPVTIIDLSDDRVECETLSEGTVIILTPQRVSPGDVVKGS